MKMRKKTGGMYGMYGRKDDGMMMGKESKSTKKKKSAKSKRGGY